MNGIHDMGGMHGFGAVDPEPEKPLFRAEWERRAFALSMAAPAPWSADEDRQACEDQPPVQYLRSPYYANWFLSLQRMLVAYELIGVDELRTGKLERPGDPSVTPLKAEDVEAFALAPSKAERPATTPALFAAGDRVRARVINPRTHTRLPRYVRGRAGQIVRVHGCHVFPDTNALRQGEDPRWLYTVSFSARELWGDDAAEGDDVLLDLWEPYLEAEAD